MCEDITIGCYFSKNFESLEETDICIGALNRFADIRDVYQIKHPHSIRSVFDLIALLL